MNKTNRNSDRNYVFVDRPSIGGKTGERNPIIDRDPDPYPLNPNGGKTGEIEPKNPVFGELDPRFSPLNPNGGIIERYPDPLNPEGGIPPSKRNPIIDRHPDPYPYPLRPTLDPFPTTEIDPKPTTQPKPKYPKGKALLSRAMELARLGNLTELKGFIEQHRGKFDINGTDEQGRNLAHYAAMSGHPGTLQFLNKAGVDMTATDNEGNTIAHVVVEKVKSMIAPSGFENFDPVSFMEKAIAFSGVDVTQPNNAGKTPLDIIAPVSNDGLLRMVPSRPVDGSSPEIICRPDRGVLELAHYLSKQENDNRLIAYKSSIFSNSDIKISVDDEANSSSSFNFNGVNKTVNNSPKNILSASGEVVSIDEQVIDDAFKAIQRGSNNER